MSSRRRLDVHKHHERSHEQNQLQNTKLDSVVTQTTATNTKLDTFSGAINNNIGDGSVKLQTYVYGHDSGNGLARPLAVTSNGELKVSNDVLEVSAETVNLNTDTLEAKVQAVTDKLDTFAGAGNNNIGEGSSKLQTYLYARDVSAGNFKPLVCDGDAHLQVDVVSTALPTGGATEATLSGLKNSLTGDGAGGDNAPGVMLKAINDNVISSNTALGVINNNALATVTAVNLNTNAQTQNGDGTGNKPGVMLDAINTNIINAEAHLGNIDGNITACNTGAVTISSALPAGSNTIGKVNIGTFDNAITIQDGGNSITIDGTITANAGTNLNTSALATQSTLADAEAHLGNIETAVQLIDNIVKNEDTAHSGGDAGVMALSVRKDTATFLAGSDADYQPLITDANGRLHSINKTARENGSETFTGSAIAIDPNTKVIFAEHNFSHTGIKFELMASIDGTNFFGTGIEFNAGGMTPGTLTGISTILGSSQSVVSFPPHIKFKFTNSDSSVQSATLSYVIQSS